MAQPEFDKTRITAIGTSGLTIALGEIVGGDYQLKSLLGSGGMGSVFCAEHVVLHKDFALKIVNPDVINENSIERFLIEAKIIARLDHPNIVRVYNMGRHKAFPYYVMELLSGQALSNYLEAGKSLSCAQLLDIFEQVADGLQYAHSKGIVHRDVKPSNIILQPQPQLSGFEAKIFDFGIAKVLDAKEPSLTSSGEIFGSPLYMSPEQCLGQEIDPRSDIYSLGCTIFHMLSGRPPFLGGNAAHTAMMHVQDVAPLLPADIEHGDELNAMLGRMMAKEKSARYRTMSQVAHDMQRILDGKPIGKSKSAKAVYSSGSSSQEHRNAKAGNFSKNSEASGSADQSNSMNFWLLLAICSIGVLAIALGSYSLWSNMQRPEVRHKFALDTIDAHSRTESPQSVNAHSANSPEVVNEANAALSADEIRSMAPIISTIEEHQGIACRHYHFPRVCLGYVNCNEDSDHAQLAKGDVYLPAKCSKRFLIDVEYPQILRHPEVFKKLGATEFTTLAIKLSEMPDYGKDIENGILSILDMARPWTDLQIVSIENCNQDPRILSAISRLSRLSTLKLAECSLKVTELAQCSFLDRLRWLELNAMADACVDPVLKRLGHSQHIEHLRLRAVLVGPGAIASLRTCPRLTELLLEKIDVNSAIVAELAQIKTLRHLRIITDSLEEVWLAALNKQENLKDVAVKSRDLSDSDIQRLRLRFPRLRFESVW